MDFKTAKGITGGLSNTTKMPGWSYSLPALLCKKGTELRKDPRSPCHGCYATKGFYMMPNVRDTLERRFQGIHHAQWVEAMVVCIEKLVSKQVPYFRWHDSGDIQDHPHLEKILEVCRRTPWVHHWIPTQEIELVETFRGQIPPNVIIRVSNRLRADFTSPEHRDTDKYPTSSVLTANTVKWKEKYKELNSKDMFFCPSSFQNHQCGSCRACWNPKIQHTLYRRH